MWKIMDIGKNSLETFLCLMGSDFESSFEEKCFGVIMSLVGSLDFMPSARQQPKPDIRCWCIKKEIVST